MSKALHADPAAADGEQGENDQRSEHRPGALVRRMGMLALKHQLCVRTRVDRGPMRFEFVYAGAPLAEESQVPEPEHVEGGEQRQ